MSPVALLTDFGVSDPWVGVMKAVILSRAPGAPIIDLTHEIPPGDVASAALRLWQAGPWLPPGTVIVAVVDPGVGSMRRAVAVSAGALRCVGPDNGIFTYLLACQKRWTAVEIAAPPSASSTFHGRDVFAPAAARLCSGAPLRRLGSPVSHLVNLPFPLVSASPAGFSGEVLCSDRFGNLVTSIGSLQRRDGSLLLSPWIPGAPEAGLRGPRFCAVAAGGKKIPFLRTFSDVPPGSPVAYIGSDGLLEIGVNAGRAVDLLHLERGAEVSLVSCASGR